MSELDFETMLNAAPCGAMVFGVSGNLLFCNQKAKDIFLSDGATGSDQYNLLEEKRRIENADMERVRLAFAGQRVEISALCLTPDSGHETWLHSLFCPNFNAAGEFTGVTAYLYDISSYHSLQHELLKEMEAEQQLSDHLSQAQRQLQQSEKLATVGQLAAGIAHEINNPIGYIGSNINTLKSYVAKLLPIVESSQKLISVEASETGADLDKQLEHLREYLKQDDIGYLVGDLSDIVDECAEGIKRVKSIVADMKGIARSGEDERDWNDIHEALDTALNIANNEIKYKASVKKDYAELPKLFCSSSQMNQIFLNILVNASQAIDEHGVITVRTREVDGNAEIDIEDTGKGIDEAGVSRIFDTFYTTKPAGQGTGLGLSIAKEIITRHGGEISVRSEVGKGTCFTIRLPIEEQDGSKEEGIQGAA